MAGYQPGVYREQGGDRLVVASTGEIDVETGGRFQVNGTDLITTGSKIDLSSASNLVSSGVYAGSGVVNAQVGYKHYVENLTSSAATIVAYGVSKIIASTALTMPLAAPVAGVEKWITAVTTAATLIITSSAAGADITTGGSTQISITTGTLAAPSWIHLLGLNSTRWTVLGQSANVTVA